MKKQTQRESNFDNFDNVQAPIYTAPDEVKKIIEQVWQLEKSRLDRKSFSHISDEILTIIKTVVQ
ncbi:MAG: hypothetical protein IGS39_19410 [Calothrix sp. C42_A2020_038]|nr:hypothetical protein [Calothrix sp. C42_A2020_038]